MASKKAPAYTIKDFMFSPGKTVYRFILPDASGGDDDGCIDVQRDTTTGALSFSSKIKKDVENEIRRIIRQHLANIYLNW